MVAFSGYFYVLNLKYSVKNFQLVDDLLLLWLLGVVNLGGKNILLNAVIIPY
jgi:hypothetical protein